MNRPTYTSLHSLLIIGIFFMLSFVYQACGKKNNEEKDLGDKIEEVADAYTEDSFFEDDESVDPSEDISSEDIDYGEDVSTSTSTPTSTTSSRSNSTYTESRSSSAISRGAYMVIAGNYLMEANADEMVSKLTKAGYTDAEKVVFDLSQYYTVVAGSYDSRSSADGISNRLTNIGIDNYVLRRKR